MKKQQQRRNKGEGSIVQLPNGNFKATITLGKGIDGKQKRKSVTCKTKTELIDKLTELKAKFIKHHIVTNITFQAFTEQWLNKKSSSLSYNSMQSYKGVCINYIYPTFGSLLLDHISAAHLPFSSLKRILAICLQENYKSNFLVVVDNHHKQLT